MASGIIGLGAFGKKISWLSMINIFTEIFHLQNIVHSRLLYFYFIIIYRKLTTPVITMHKFLILAASSKIFLKNFFILSSGSSGTPPTPDKRIGLLGR